VLRRWLPLLAVVALLAAVLAAATLADAQIDVRPLGGGAAETRPPRDLAPTPPTVDPAAADRQDPQQTFTLPPWVTTVMAGFCIAVVLVVVGLLLWFNLQGRLRETVRAVAPDGKPRARPVAGQVAEVAAAVDAGIADLSDADRDSRRAVIGCWLRLEQAAAAAGTPRLPSDSPADHVLRLLSQHAISRSVLDRFAIVYRHARYSTDPVDDAMRQETVAALRQLRSELTARVGASS
jgi:hypothetical protein